jgi:type IV fimbrial biogenesis protein FimT
VLTRTENQLGFTLVELIITILIVAILLGLAAPSIGIWVQNAKIRTTADAILNGLQMARAESVKRNTSARFQLTDTLSNTCVLSTTNSNWVVSLNDVTGQCGSAPADPAANTALNPALAYIIQTRASAEGSTGVDVVAGSSAFIFNGLGRLTSAAGAIDVCKKTYDTDATCPAPGGSVRSMRITVSSGGTIRMCNPALSINTNPQGC